MAVKRLTTEQLALNNWSKWASDSDGRWDHTNIQSASFAYLANQAKEQTRRLRNIDDSMNNIKHYFHELDNDGFREIIQAKAVITRRDNNKKIIKAVGCNECDAGAGVACSTPTIGYRKPHSRRIKAYEAGA